LASAFIGKSGIVVSILATGYPVYRDYNSSKSLYDNAQNIAINAINSIDDHPIYEALANSLAVSALFGGTPGLLIGGSILALKHTGVIKYLGWNEGEQPYFDIPENLSFYGKLASAFIGKSGIKVSSVWIKTLIFQQIFKFVTKFKLKFINKIII